MPAHPFPDNTVLCNFAAVDRLDLLEAAFDGRGRWTEAVAYETGRSASMLPALSEIASGGWLGEPIEVTDGGEIQRIQRVGRIVFGGSEHQPLKHLGEAETCYIILNWAEFAGAWWISDDAEALHYARRQDITTRETIDLVYTAAINGAATADEGFRLMQQMAEADRQLRLPKSPAELLQQHGTSQVRTSVSSFTERTATWTHVAGQAPYDAEVFWRLTANCRSQRCGRPGSHIAVLTDGTTE